MFLKQTCMLGLQDGIYLKLAFIHSTTKITRRKLNKNVTKKLLLFFQTETLDSMVSSPKGMRIHDTRLEACTHACAVDTTYTL